MKKIIDWLKMNKKIWIISLGGIIFLALLFIGNKFLFSNEKKVENWVKLSEFPNILEMKKEGTLLSYPEINIISEADGEVMILNVSTGDIVNERDILLQIENENSEDNYMQNLIDHTYDKYINLRNDYDDFKSSYSDIKDLENQLSNAQIVLNEAIDLGDKDGQNIRKNEVESLNNKLYELKSEYNIKNQEYEHRLQDMDTEMQLFNIKSDKYYYELDKFSPRATISGIIGNVYVQIGDVVSNGDKLFTIINNNLIPEISVGLDFNEYLITKELSEVSIVLESENRGEFTYEGEIYTRSPILNSEGKYTITIRFLDENVPNLILGDGNTKISVIFYIESDSIWLPEICFTELGKNSGKAILRDENIKQEKEIGIKSRQDGRINIDYFYPYSLENGIEKDDIEILCGYIE